MTRLTHKSLRAGLEEVAARDPHVAEALALVGFPKLRRRKPGFEALFRAIVGQQVSIRQKVAYARHLAEMVGSGDVRLNRLPRMTDEEAIAELIRIKGIGRWSAEIYLLSALGRRDMWPVDDLALMIAAQRMKRLEARPDRKGMIALGEAWRPWRGAVAHLLWHYYSNAPAPRLVPKPATK